MTHGFSLMDSAAVERATHVVRAAIGQWEREIGEKLLGGPLEAFFHLVRCDDRVVEVVAGATLSVLKREI